MRTSHFFVSVIMVLENDADIIAELVEEISAVLDQDYENYELVFIDNGSTDKTREQVDLLLKEFKCIRYIRLSTKVEHQVAIFAGLETVIGDVIVTMSPYYDPSDLIKLGVEKAHQDGKAVFGQYEKRFNRSFVGALFGKVFYWYVNKVLGFKVPPNTTDFRVLHRKELNALLQIRDVSKHLMFLNTYTGFDWIGIKYNEIERKKKKRKSVRELTQIARDIIITNSVHPLKFLAVVVAVLGVVLAAITWADAFSLKNSNWPYILMAILLAVLGLYLYLLSEYVRRGIKRANQRPEYVVVEEKNSAVLIAQADRRNVFNVSL